MPYRCLKSIKQKAFSCVCVRYFVCFHMVYHLFLCVAYLRVHIFICVHTRSHYHTYSKQSATNQPVLSAAAYFSTCKFALVALYIAAVVDIILYLFDAYTYTLHTAHSHYIIFFFLFSYSKIIVSTSNFKFGDARHVHTRSDSGSGSGCSCVAAKWNGDGLYFVNVVFRNIM